MGMILLVAVSLSTIVYSAFSTKLQIEGEAVLRSDNEIRITNIEKKDTTNGAYETYNNKHSKDTVSIYATLPKNATITYEVEIVNKTGQDYKISDIKTLTNSNSNIIVENYISPGDIIDKDTPKTFTIKLSNKTTTEQKITLVYQYKFIERNYAMIQAFDWQDTTKFRSNEYREKIKTITLSNKIAEPANVIASWNLGVNENDNVKAYLTVNQSNTSMYDLYIEGDGELYANYDSKYLFGGLTKLDTINNLNILDTSKSTTIRGMFYKCQSLTSIDLSNFNTINVLDTSHMFRECKKLKTIDTSSFNTSKVKDMSCMFQECNALTSLNISSFNTQNVTNMVYMFIHCWSLQELDVTSFDTGKVVFMHYMFYNCNKLKTLDLSNFNTNNVTNMSEMFRTDTGLNTIYVGPNWKTDKVTSSANMFGGCTNLSGAVSYDSAKVDKTMANYTTGYLTYKGQ